MNKQIEEMALDIHHEGSFGLELSATLAEALFEKGYRKATDVAKEIFEEIEAIKCVGLLPSSWVKQFAELKKKYTESEKEK